MELQNSQPNTPEQPKKSWFASHMILGYVFLFAVLAAAVAGIYYWQTVRQIPAKIDFPVHKDVTADWKTYTNTQYGFEFKYPEPKTESDLPGSAIVKDGAFVEDQGNIISVLPIKQITGPNGNGQLDIVPNNYRRFDYGQWRNGVDYKLTETTLGSKKVMVYEKINPNLLGAIKAIRVVDFPVGWNDTNEISYQLYDNSKTESIKLFDQILSTFKFTDSIDTSNWKTYTNSQYGFEFKYPANLTFKQNQFDKDNIIIEDPKAPSALDSSGYMQNLYFNLQGFLTLYKKPGQNVKDLIIPDYNYTINVKHVSLSPLEQKLINNVTFYEFTSESGFYFFSDGSGGAGFPVKTRFVYFDSGSGSFEAYFPDSTVFNQILSTFKFTQ